MMVARRGHAGQEPNGAAALPTSLEISALASMCHMDLHGLIGTSPGPWQSHMSVLRPALPGSAGLARRSARRRYCGFRALINSTSNTKVASGGMTPPAAPLEP
jgi:hypothetical protein